MTNDANDLAQTSCRCQFLIGKVQPSQHMSQFTVDGQLSILCQFLIGKVQQPYFRLSVNRIHCFWTLFNYFLPKKSVDLHF